MRKENDEYKKMKIRRCRKLKRAKRPKMRERKAWDMKRKDV